jgi:hypothetical protein
MRNEKIEAHVIIINESYQKKLFPIQKKSFLESLD